MKDKYLKYLVIGMVVAGIFAMFGWFASQRNRGEFEAVNIGGGHVVSAVPMLGSVSNAKSPPTTQSFGNSTTTDAGGSLVDGGDTIQQSYKTEGLSAVRFDMLAVGGTVTSTLTIQPQISFNETDWFNYNASSTAGVVSGTGTTTLVAVPFKIAVDPGTTSTTLSYLFDVLGSKYMRFILNGENISTDSTDGVQAWIQLQFIDPIVR